MIAAIGVVYRRFYRTASNEIEPFARYLTQGIKYYVGRYIRRQLAAELTLKQYARVHLHGTATEMVVPATYPVSLKTDDVFVPLLLRDSTGGTMEYHELLERSSSRMLIVGEPGSGKSSLMKRTFRDACRRANADPRRAPLPILFELRKLSRLPRERLETLTHARLFDLCVASLGEASVFRAAGAVSHLREGPGYLILLDGLDEVANDASVHAIRAVSELVEHLSLVSPRSSLVVSTRTQHYLMLRDREFTDSFEVRSIRPFSLADVYRFLVRWPFEVSRNRRDEITRLFARIRQLPSLTEMCTNPLALAMFVARDQQTGGAISPETRSEFYTSLVAELLVDRRQRTTDDAVARRRTREARENILGPVCLEHLLDPNEAPNSVPEARLLAAVIAAGHDPAEAEKVVSRLAIETGLFSPEREGETYRFLHLTLCEFLAAREVVNEEADGWARIRERLAIEPDDSTGHPPWASRLAEVVAFTSGLAVRKLRREIIGDLIPRDDGLMFMRAVIEAQSYDDNTVLQRLNDEADRLGATPKADWGDSWFLRLRSLIAVLRDVGAGTTDGLARSASFILPSASQYLMVLIDRHDAEKGLLATLARDDAEAAVAIAEASGRDGLLETVAAVADDFSVLQAILARCDEGVVEWKRALVHSALTRREIADVLMLARDDFESGVRVGWSASFITRGTIYGGLLDDVLATPDAWLEEYRATMSRLAEVRPPQHRFWSRVRAMAGMSSESGPERGLVVVAVLGSIGAPLVFVLNVGGQRAANLAAAAIAPAIVGTLVIAWSSTRTMRIQLRLERSRLRVRLTSKQEFSQLTISMGAEHFQIAAKSRGSSANADMMSRFWRQPVLEEALNLGRWRYSAGSAESSSRWLGIPRWRRMLAGVPDADLEALAAARALREEKRDIVAWLSAER